MTAVVLFDVDGTLVDSNDAHARAWVSALAEAGYDVPFERIRPFMGMGGDRMLPQVADDLDPGSDLGKTIAKRRLEIFLSRELPTVRPMAGARRLLAEVRARGARVVVATSAKRDELDRLLNVGDFTASVDVTTTSDDAQESKPAPDIVQAALTNAGAAAGDAVMIGDTRYDIASAHAAGIPCIALRCGGSDPATLNDADAVYANPAELAAALDRAPFAWAAAPVTQTAPEHLLRPSRPVDPASLERDPFTAI